MNIYISLIYAGPFIWILIIQICVSLLKQVKTGSNRSYLVQIGQECSAHGKITHEMGPKKYMNIFGCPRIEWMKLQIYSDAKEFIEQITEYIQIKEKSQIRI